MKIAQVVTLKESVPPVSKNGLEFVVSWLTEELVRRGHEVTLFAPANSKTQARLIPITPESNDNLSIWNTILAGSMAHEFDIIHCHDFFGPLITPFITTPIVQTIHHAHRDEFLPKYVESQKSVEHLKFVIDQYAKIHYVPVSKNQEKIFRSQEHIYFKKYHTIHNGIPVEQFEYNETPKDYLFYIGYINKDKGADVAVQVAKKLGMKLILAGNNFGQEEFFNQHIQSHLSEDIEYVGAVNFEQKNNLYKNARATLAPIHWDEPFGLTLIESQACGTPVIAFNKGASREIVNDGETGFVVNSEEEMIEAVKKLDTISRKNCREWVEQNFSVKKMVDEYEKHYNEILVKNKDHKKL